MAGRKSAPKNGSNIFTYALVSRTTLANWAADVDLPDLREKLKLTLQQLDGYTFKFRTPNARLMAGMFDELIELDQTYEFQLRISYCDVTWYGKEYPESQLVNMTVTDMFNSGSKEILLMMMLGTYRGLIKQQQGPIPGTGLNLTIAGMIAVCKIVQAKFDSSDWVV